MTVALLARYLLRTGAFLTAFAAGLALVVVRRVAASTAFRPDLMASFAMPVAMFLVMSTADLAVASFTAPAAIC